jgi:LDH2 family malate/lactate/ureidoglycolate dehydrogenase
VPVTTATELRAIVCEALVAAGASATNAEIVADHLVLANLSGVDTHGVWHLAAYVEALQQGLIDGVATPAVLQEGPNMALVSGHWTFGQVAAKFAMERAIEIARNHDVAVVGLVQCHHIGRLGHFTEMAADAGLIAQVWAGGFAEEAPVTMPYGGRERVLSTNPISIAFPAGHEPRTMFDFATTTLSGVKVDNARRRGEALPPGAIVDRDGRPSTDPNDFYDGGGMIPFGGHKGYALSMAAEFLGRIFTGSSTFAEAERGGSAMRHQGVTMIVTRADLFRSRADYDREADEMEQRTRAIPPARGFTEVLVPGDPEWRTRLDRQTHGIPVEDAIWTRIEALPR